MGCISPAAMALARAEHPKQIPEGVVDQLLMAAAILVIILTNLAVIQLLMKLVVLAELILATMAVAAQELVVLLAKIQIRILRLVAHLQTRAILRTRALVATVV